MSTTAQARWRLDSREGLLFAGLAVVFAPALLALSSAWWNADYMSHGFLVPLVAVWIASRSGEDLMRHPCVVDRRGLVALCLAVLASLAGALAGSLTLRGLALVGALAAAVWFRRGPAWLRGLAFPLAYLLFMVPLPDDWHRPIVVRLQEWVSAASVTALYGLGVPVYREAYFLQLVSGERVEVGEACSGVTSVYTLLAIGVLLAALSLRRRRTRIGLVALVIPVAMAGNLARVVATVLLASRIGVARATEGVTHAALGLLTYVVAVGLLLVADAALRRYEHRLAT